MTAHDELSELETTILNDIRAHANGGRYAARIVWSAETEAVATAVTTRVYCDKPDWRKEIDVTLQVLRRRGLITYIKGAGWQESKP
jgi:hypothetical protein